MKAMNINESYKWLETHTNLTQNTRMLVSECLSLAVKTGVLFEVKKDYFIPAYTTCFENSRYAITEVYKVDDEIVKSEMLQYPYRAKARLVKACGEYKENVIKYHSFIDLTIEF